MSLIYVAEPDALKARDRAFSLEEARLAASGDPNRKLGWMMTAVDDAYSPYLVKIHAIDGDQATISFVDCKTGEVMEQQHKIDLSNRELVWTKLPSTLEGWTPGSADCAFLFMSSKIHDMTQDALLSSGGSDKWPRAAGVMTTFEEVRELVQELVARDPQLLEQLPDDKGRLLAQLLGRPLS